jgi:TRAP-type mannitol/chloroaromatic compound transport system substrate-binding protein
LYRYQKDLMMAWYDIPKVALKYVYDEQGEVIGVLFDSAEFEKLAEKMEDFLDNEAVERAKKEPIKKLYTHEQIKAMIESKKR